MTLKVSDVLLDRLEVVTIELDEGRVDVRTVYRDEDSDLSVEKREDGLLWLHEYHFREYPEWRRTYPLELITKFSTKSWLS